LLNFQFHLQNVVIISDLGFRKKGALLDDLASDRAAVPDWQAALDQCQPTFRNIMPARIRRRAHPFAAARRGDGGEPLARCRAHLLELVQYICPCLLEKGETLFSHLDRIGQVNRAWCVWHFYYTLLCRVVAIQLYYVV